MSALIWPFPPRSEMSEMLEWKTNILRAKGSEQRIALRDAPRRVFNLDHFMRDLEYSQARGLIRSAQGGDGFLVPDWGQGSNVGAVNSGSSVPISVDLSNIDIGDTAILWQSSSLYEAVTFIDDSSGVSIDTVVNDYTNAKFMPLWGAYAPEGLSDSRAPGRTHQSSIAMMVYENTNLSDPAIGQYRGLDLLDVCPVVGSGDMEESLAWPVTEFDNEASIPHYIRQRNLPDMMYSMRWHVFSRDDSFQLRKWLHYRRGRQRAFWMSSRGQDMELAESIGSASNTVTVFDLPGVPGLGVTTPFDIDITTVSGQSYYRRVTGGSVGTPVDGRTTIDMTIDSPIGVDLTISEVARVSFLRCTRFNADRIELLHRASGGMAVRVPCIQVPEP